MNRHENARLKKRLNYKCDRCDKTFTFSSSYSYHKQVAHGLHEKTFNKIIEIEKPIFICDECGAKFNRKDSLVVHIASKHGDGENYKCNRCDKTFTFSSNYYRHKRVVHGVHEKTSNKTVDRHENSVLKGKHGYKCDQCDKTFTFSSNYYRHKRVIHGDCKKTNKIMCSRPGCSSTFRSAFELKRHEIAVHEKQRNYICDQCGKTFAFSNSYYRHRRSVHSECRKTSNTIECSSPGCLSTFPCKSELNFHLKNVHKSDRPYVCTKPECEATFHFAFDLKRHEIAVHEKQRNYKCDQCEKFFAISSNYHRHKRNVHGKCEKKSEMIVCLKPECSSTFSSKSELNAHMRNIHKSDRRYVCTKRECEATFRSPFDLKRHEIAVHEKQRNYKCDQCEKTFAISSNYRRHKRSIHGIYEERSCDIMQIQKPTFICAECGVTYSRKDNLVQHITNQHGVDEYECHYCGFKVKAKVNLKRHIHARHFSKKNTMPVKSGPFRCVLCELSYQYQNELKEHYVKSHDVELNTETLTFSSLEEFSSWKNKFEDSTITRFRLRRKSKNTFSYICHRSGFYNNQSTGKRSLFQRGSKKLNGFCPASITLKLNKDNSSYTATLIPTHVGHAQNDTKELKFIFFRKEERENLAKRIAAGVPLRRILDDEVLHQSPNEITRRALRSKDLYNVQASFNIKANGNFVGLRKNDLNSVEEFVYEYKHSILLYKRQGESGPEEFSDCQLNDNDTILVFMSPLQKNLLKKYGNEIVCLDGTHGLNSCGFILHVLLVLDHDGEGIPVAFLISNRKDKMVIKVLLRCIREKMCEITSPHTLMTDMQESYYNAWIEEMDKPQLHLYCIWHVWHDWEKHLPKRNEQLKQDLCDLTVETCLNTFQAKLEKILSPSADNEVTAFLRYFKEQYCDNNKWMYWSYAYRLQCGINTYMHLQAFHDTMKYFFSRGKTMRDLYSALQIIVRYVRRKTYDLNVKQIHGYIPTRLSALRKAHKEVEGKSNIFIQKIGKEWLVPSFEEPKDGCEELYAVCRSQENCPAEEDEIIGSCPLICNKCDVCAHKYTCSCIENSSRSHMCKHIHAVVLFERRLVDSIETPPIHDSNVACSETITESVELDENTQLISYNDDLDGNTQSFSRDDGNDKTQKERRKKLQKRMTELMQDMSTEEQYELMNSCLDAYQRSSCLKKQLERMIPEQYSSDSVPSSSLKQPTNIQQNPRRFVLIPGPPVHSDSNNSMIPHQSNHFQKGMPSDMIPYPHAIFPSQKVSQHPHPHMRLSVPPQDSPPIEMYNIVETSYDI